MDQITLDSLKSFTVDGKTYDFLPLEDWELNDCCLFEETAGVEYAHLLGEGAMSPSNLRAAMFVVARHYGLDITLEDAGKVKLISFMQALGGEAAAGGGEGGDEVPPVRAAPKRRAPRKGSSRGSRS